MDFSACSTDELRSLVDGICREIKRREKLERARILNELEELAKQAGYSLGDFLENLKPQVRNSRPMLLQKYRDSVDQKLTGAVRRNYSSLNGDCLQNAEGLERISTINNDF